MTPDMKRLVETVENVFLPMRLDYLEGHEAEAIVRAVLTELREVSESMSEAAWNVERYGDRGMERAQPADELRAMLGHILAEPATA